MWPGSRHLASCAPEVASLIERSLAHPPLLAMPGMPLHDAPLDHVAIALENAREVRRLWQELSDRGARVTERFQLWPEKSPGCPPVPDHHKKYMVTLDCWGLLVVFLAPHNEEDLIAQFFRRVGGRGVHHIAFKVPVITETLQECLAVPTVRQISRLAVDPEALSQVFLRSNGDERIVELVERTSPFGEVTFTCGNVATLTSGEDSDRP